MIKLVLHKTFAVSLALLVLFSTISITIEKHFCGSRLVDVALFVEADKCSMEGQELQLATTVKKSCCKDTVDVIEGQDELKTNSSINLETINKYVATAFIYSYLNTYNELSQQIIPHKNYVPPNLYYDRQILEQVFLI